MSHKWSQLKAYPFAIYGLIWRPLWRKPPASTSPFLLYAFTRTRFFTHPFLSPHVASTFDNLKAWRIKSYYTTHTTIITTIFFVLCFLMHFLSSPQVHFIFYSIQMPVFSFTQVKVPFVIFRPVACCNCTNMYSSFLYIEPILAALRPSII